MLRVLINDLVSPYTYDDDTLTKILSVSAIYNIQDIDFDVTYTISLAGTPDISPDPSGDSIFTNFMVMKAACQADFSTYRTKALAEGVTARCGPATLAVLGNLRGFKELLTVGPCATYESMKLDYVFGNGQMCRAILSPFVGNNFSVDSLSTAYQLERDHGNYV